MTNESEKKGRAYRKRKRADQEQATRERITEAAVKLHGTVGPARTTISGIADEAGVQRATVYRHFPDEASLFAACSAHYWSQNPRPDPATWSEIRDPGERLRVGLTELYAFFGRTEEMLEKTSRDAPLVEAMAGPSAAFRAFMGSLADVFLRGRPERGRRRDRVRAAIAHAASFPTWRSLVREQGLSDADAVALMAGLVEGAGEL
jgi:AcrR family transcriptional regulator